MCLASATDLPTYPALLAFLRLRNKNAKGYFYNATLFQADITLTLCCSLNVESPLCVEKLPPQLEMLFEKVLELSVSRASLQEAGDWGEGGEIL